MNIIPPKRPNNKFPPDPKRPNNELPPESAPSSTPTREQQERIDALTAPLFQKKDTPEQKEALQNEIGHLPPEKASKIITLAKTLFRWDDNGSHRADLINAVAQLPEGKENRLIMLAKNLYQENDTGSDMAACLKAVANLPEGKETHFIKLAQKAYKEGDSSSDRADLISALSKIPERTGEVIELAKSLQENQSTRTLIEILESFARLPSDSPKGAIALFKQLISLLEKNTDPNYAADLQLLSVIIEQLPETSPQRISRIIQLAQFTSSESDSVHTLVRLIKVIAKLPFEPPEKANSLVEQAQLLLGKTRQTEDLIRTLDIMTESSSFERGKHLMGCWWAWEDGLFMKLITSRADLKKDFLDYLFKTIQESTENPVVLEHFGALESCKEGLHLISDDDPRYQEAVLHVIPALNQTQLQDPATAPYILFGKLVELSKTSSHFTPPFDPMLNASIHLSFFQQRLKNTKVKNKELDPSISLASLQQYEKKLTERIHQLPAPIKQQITDLIEQRLGGSLSLIENNVTEEPVYFKALLSPADPEEPAPIEKIKLYASLAYIAAQDATLKQGETFTAQEEAFLLFCSDVLTCKSGKREGVAQFYRYIQSLKEQPDLSSEEDLTTFMESLIEENLDSLFTHTSSFMEKVAPKGLGTQPQHQIIYVKNLIASIIGLPHQIQFDISSSMVDSDLLKKTREEVLSIFYKYFTPRLLVTALREKVHEQLEKIKQEVQQEDLSTLPDPEQWTDDYWKNKVEQEKNAALQRQAKGLPLLPNQQAGKGWEERKEEYIALTVKEREEEEKLTDSHQEKNWKSLPFQMKKEKVKLKIKQEMRLNQKRALITELFKSIESPYPLWERDPHTEEIIGLTEQGALAVLCQHGVLQCSPST